MAFQLLSERGVTRQPSKKLVPPVLCVLSDHIGGMGDLLLVIGGSLGRAMATFSPEVSQ